MKRDYGSIPQIVSKSVRKGQRLPVSREQEVNDILARLLYRYPPLCECEEEIRVAYNILKDAFENGAKLLICGNGGSAADAEHISGELMKGFLKQRPLPTAVKEHLDPKIADRLQVGFPALSLSSHYSVISAFANDVDPELVYAQQVVALGSTGDVVLGISTSGNSKNILAALTTATGIGLSTIGLTGRSGGLMAKLCDVTISVPANDTPDVQEMHLPLYHALCAMIEATFFEEGLWNKSS